jgi:hypothetical protein
MNGAKFSGALTGVYALPASESGEALKLGLLLGGRGRLR